MYLILGIRGKKQPQSQLFCRKFCANFFKWRSLFLAKHLCFLFKDTPHQAIIGNLCGNFRQNVLLLPKSPAVAPCCFLFISPQKLKHKFATQPWAACPWVPTAPFWRWLRTSFSNASSLAFSGPGRADGWERPQPLAGTLWGCLYLWGGFRRRERVIWQCCGCRQDRKPSWLAPSFPHWQDTGVGARVP